MAKKKTIALEAIEVSTFNNDQLADQLEQHTYQITSRTNWENSRLIKQEAARRLRAKK